MKMKIWIEAMRLRTLPVSVAGVICAIGYCLLHECFMWLPSVICVLFAVTAQVASNFANEYYDYVDGIDKPGREGPRRGVTEGDITPRTMKIVTYATIALACIEGLSLIYWGGWWLIAVGLAICIGLLAYSTGPYPLSRHGLGEVAVIFFFGLIPVNFTYYIESGIYSQDVMMASLAIGLMGANVLIVNNYRDVYDDVRVGKTTLAVKFGRRVVSALYLTNGIIAIALVYPAWAALPWGCAIIPCLYLIGHVFIWRRMLRLDGAALTPCLGMTAMLMLVYSAGFVAAVALN